MTLFKKAMDDFARLGGTAIDFNVTIGDPLLDPNLLERARYKEALLTVSGPRFCHDSTGVGSLEHGRILRIRHHLAAISITLSGR